MLRLKHLHRYLISARLEDVIDLGSCSGIALNTSI